MKCPICGNPLRPSKKDPSYGLCDNCKKKFKLKKETPDQRKAAPSTAKSIENKPKKKKKSGLLKFFLFFFIIVIIAGLTHFFFFGKANSSNDSSADSSQTADTSIGNTSTSVLQEETYNNIQISLINTSESKGGDLASPSDGNIFYICEFQITNNSEDNITINSLSDIEAFCGDYSVSEDIAGLLLPETEGKSSLDGTIAMGQTFTGVVTYQIPKDYDQMQFRLSPEFWNGDTATFTVSK